MQKAFGIEGKFFSYLETIFDLLVLNLVFLIGCLPIVTIGASLTALYSVTLKMVRHEHVFVGKDFWNNFRKNLKQSTMIWLGLLLLCSIFILLAWTIVRINSIFLFPILLIVTVVLLSFMFIFPLIARFENRSIQLVKNAFLISFHSTAISILLVAITILVIGIIPIFLPKLVFIWLFLGFSFSAFLKSFLIEKVFNSLIKEEEA